VVFFRNILLGGILILVIFMLVTTAGEDLNTDQARLFLTKLQEGDPATLIPLFGDNTCHCQPRGGFRAYLRYESGEADNLAVLYGKKFEVDSAMSSKTVPTAQKFQGSGLPWEQPESTEVEIKLNFDPRNYSPYFVPLDLAYGIPMKEDDFKKFCSDPSNEFYRCFALRLRPQLGEGVLPPPANPDPARKPEFTADLMLELLPAEDAKYVKPRDLAGVIDADGKARSAVDYEKDFPRLKSCGLRLYVVRRGKFQRWAIRKGKLKDPVFVLADGKELSLKTPDKFLEDMPGSENGEGEAEAASPK